jgi:hypothetical protein
MSFRLEILKAGKPREVGNLKGSLCGTFTRVKNQSILEETEWTMHQKTLHAEKIQKMRNKNFWPLEVILKSEGPLPDWRVFSKRRFLFSGK